MTQANAIDYQDFRTFATDLAEPDRARLSGLRLLFCYPVLESNEFELVEQPVSQRILMSIGDKLGCEVDSEVAAADTNGISFAPETVNAPDFIVIHPMIGVLSRLPAILAEYKRRFPEAEIVLQTSDQHQHEKVIGGPRATEIAHSLIARMPDIDWILIGFAEHALLSVLLKRPSGSVLGRAGIGDGPPTLFSFDSLPEPMRLATMARDRTIRMQRGRGCLAPCTYCIEGQINRTLKGERGWDGLGTEAFIERVQKVADQGYFFVTITDSSFEDPGARGLGNLLEFCDHVLERDIKLSFKIHMRAESLLKMSFGEFEKMKAAGIDVIGCGVESGNTDELKFIRKIASRDQSFDACRHVEDYGKFAFILGYLMLSPFSTAEMTVEKIEFLRGINRGWDFLILTNRLLTFWGTVMHRELMEMGLIEDGPVQSGYVDYKFRDSGVADLDRAITRVKREHPVFMKINNLMFDAINLEARMLNPANANYLALAESNFRDFCDGMNERKARLTNIYCDAMQGLLTDPDAPFAPGFDADAEYRALEHDIAECLAPLSSLPEEPRTLYLHTWMSVVNKFSVAS